LEQAVREAEPGGAEKSYWSIDMTTRTGIIIKGTKPINAVVIPKGKEGDEYLQNFNGIAAVYNSEKGEYEEETECFIVEVSNDIRDIGVNNGWIYVDNNWVDTRPPEEELT
jgi:hypothetical protein